MESNSVLDLIAQAAEEQWEELNLSGMDLSELPESIGSLTNLTSLDTIELLKLITTLRQTATQFPAEIQEGTIIDIEDLETEIQKPADNRSIPRLKRSLIALLAAAGTIVTPILGRCSSCLNCDLE